ncbi:unnamed protein product [Brassica napus]|uniref:(rape) hypothetical protein n=1 Tax=Brassica napus TaxID=3708 RepID=A0A816J753_BRANA|nr:unnamed protein product [Brassica napus]
MFKWKRERENAMPRCQTLETRRRTRSPSNERADQLEKKDTKEENDEDLNSVAGPPTHEINHTSYIGASSDIGAFNEGYLCNHEEFDHETTCYRLSTQPEHAANWFHTKRSNGLGFIPFTSQTTYTASEVVLFKESNFLLKKCATQTHVWKPGDHSLHLRPLVELIPCTKPHWISQILHHSNLPFLEQICNKTQRQVFSILGCEFAIYFINQKLPKAPRIFQKLLVLRKLNKMKTC